MGSATAVGSGRGVSVGLLEHPVISDSVRRIKISFRTFIPAILPVNLFFKLCDVIFFMGNKGALLLLPDFKYLGASLSGRECVS